MLYLTYLRFELRHRMRQAIFIAAGLAVGVGLVITVSAASAGVKNGQARVLHGLYGIGTDITVTRPYTRSDTEAGREIPPPGHQFEYLGDANQGLFTASAASSIAALPQVRAAVGMLALDQTTQSTDHGPSSPGKGLPVTILVDGVDTANRALGPLSQARVISGRDLTAADADADAALVDSGYARAHRLHAGSVITLAHVSFRVIGIVSQPPGTVPAVLIPIRTGQRVARLGNKMTTVYVAAASATAVSAVAGKISALLPWADVTTSASLASEISGSLGTTATLATDLGRWVAAAALAAAFALAAILTVASVSRRVREFGTLKALGWRARRITTQVLGESAVIGLAGALAGVALGFGASALISALARKLTATVAAAPGHGEPQGFVGGVSRSCPTCAPTTFSHTLVDPGTYRSLPVHFTAPVSLSVVLLAVALGLAGALLAGALGGWRAARMRPAAALVRVG